MKKLLVLPALVAAGMAFGQYTQSLFRFGVTANLYQSNIKNIHWASEGRMAPSVGVFAVVPFRNEGQADIGRPGGFFFVPQLELSWDGEKNQPETGDQKYYATMISLPMNIRYYFAFDSSAENRDFFVQAGPSVGFVVADKAEGPSDALSADNKERVNYIAHHDANFKKFNYGLTVGAGYRISDNWEVFARYDHGLAKAYKTNPSGEGRAYHYKLGGGISYTFGTQR